MDPRLGGQVVRVEFGSGIPHLGQDMEQGLTVTDRVEEMCMEAWPILMIGGEACAGLGARRPVLSIRWGGALVQGRNIAEVWPIPGMGAGYGLEQVGLNRGRLQVGGRDSPVGAELI